jgi:hypothetical protein
MKSYKFLRVQNSSDEYRGRVAPDFLNKGSDWFLTASRVKIKEWFFLLLIFFFFPFKSGSILLKIKEWFYLIVSFKRELPLTDIYYYFYIFFCRT